MNLEQIEFKLVELDRNIVTIVVPHFGRISFSYPGILSAITHKQSHDVSFHLELSHGTGALVFHAIDVDKFAIDESKQTKTIIYLKGPHQPSHEESWRL